MKHHLSAALEQPVVGPVHVLDQLFIGVRDHVPDMREEPELADEMPVHIKPEILALLDIEESIVKVRKDEPDEVVGLTARLYAKATMPGSGNRKAGCSGRRVVKTGVVELRNGLTVRMTITALPR